MNQPSTQGKGNLPFIIECFINAWDIDHDNKDIECTTIKEEAGKEEKGSLKKGKSCKKEKGSGEGKG